MPLLISCSGWVYYTEDLEHCGPHGDVTDVNTDTAVSSEMTSHPLQSCHMTTLCHVVTLYNAMHFSMSGHPGCSVTCLKAPAEIS